MLVSLNCRAFYYKQVLAIHLHALMSAQRIWFGIVWSIYSAIYLVFLLPSSLQRPLRYAGPMAQRVVTVWIGLTRSGRKGGN